MIKFETNHKKVSSNRELFLRHLAQTSDFPMGVEIAYGKGSFLFGPNGEQYLDLISGIAVSNLGHQHPVINQAIIDQVHHNMHVMVYGEFIQSPQVKLAEKLTSLLPLQLNAVYLVNSGSEAVEGAMKLCKRYTGRAEIIACHLAYHGSLQGALSMIGDRHMQDGFFPLLPGISRIGFNNLSEINHITEKHAAVFVEPVQGEAGIRVADLAFLQALRKRCDETGTLLVFDEIQSGYGRTGKLFAFEHYGVVPDVLLLAKGFGGGMPLGGFIASQEILSCLRNDPVLGHISTFGGHPVSCVASLAALHVILDEALMEQIPAKEKLFREKLTHPAIKEIRGIGLMLAIQLPDFDFVLQVIHECLRLGLISDWFLFSDSSLRIAPPLNISFPEIELACSILQQAISNVYSGK